MAIWRSSTVLTNYKEVIKLLTFAGKSVSLNKINNPVMSGTSGDVADLVHTTHILVFNLKEFYMVKYYIYNTNYLS